MSDSELKELPEGSIAQVWNERDNGKRLVVTGEIHCSDACTCEAKQSVTKRDAISAADTGVLADPAANNRSDAACPR